MADSSTTYQPPYRGAVPRFGIYAGPGYTGGRSLNGTPTPADWDVKQFELFVLLEGQFEV